MKCPSFFPTLAVGLTLILAGCSYSSDSIDQLSCDDTSSPTSAGVECIDGVWVRGLDVSPDLDGSVDLDESMDLDEADDTSSVVCGDGRVELDEECDPRNGASDPGCLDCKIVEGWQCDNNTVDLCTPICGDAKVLGDEVCDEGPGPHVDPGCIDTCSRAAEGFVCPEMGGKCSRTCGDGVIDDGEQCDTNSVSIVGCDGCAEATGWLCSEDASGVTTACESVCGDGILAVMIDGQGESCDDNNLGDGDGCSSLCEKEPGFACVPSGAGSMCDSICGDGVIVAGETCDDSDQQSGDGCDSVCAVEAGFECPTQNGVGGRCTLLCGNGNNDPGEGCDDGNRNSGDGCDSTCQPEAGYQCASFFSCAPKCGDSLVISVETCDDGDTQSGDGCSALCEEEAGYSCPNNAGAGGRCELLCGNGQDDTSANYAEACDDGGRVDGDGCNSMCQVESGYVCPGFSSCVPICGDGTIIAPEQCDDNNPAAGDGCSSSCQIEAGYTCPNVGQSCIPDCGNGFDDAGEECDDGNSNNGDGCDSSCEREDDYFCPTFDACFGGFQYGSKAVLPSYGGNGGNAVTKVECPAGELAIGIKGSVSNEGTSDARIQDAQLICAPVAYTIDGQVQWSTPQSTSAEITGIGTIDKESQCPSDRFLVGLRIGRLIVSGNLVVSYLYPRCAKLEFDSSGVLSAGNKNNVNPGIGEVTGSRNNRYCADDDVVSSIEGKYGALIDSIIVECAPLGLD